MMDGPRLKGWPLNLLPLAVLVMPSCALLSACSTPPAPLPLVIEAPPRPPLPAAARAPNRPQICQPSCLDGLRTMRERQTISPPSPTAQQAPEIPASAHTK